METIHSVGKIKIHTHIHTHTHTYTWNTSETLIPPQENCILKNDCASNGTVASEIIYFLSLKFIHIFLNKFNLTKRIRWWSNSEWYLTIGCVCVHIYMLSTNHTLSAYKCDFIWGMSCWVSYQVLKWLHFLPRSRITEVAYGWVSY